MEVELEPLHVYKDQPNALEWSVQNLRQHGCVQIHQVQESETVATFNTKATEILSKVTTALQAQSLDYTTQTTAFSFSDVASRDRGRLDVQYDTAQFTSLTDHPLILSIVNSILGNDCMLTMSGIVYSLPGSVAQAWHRDGPHLTDNPTSPAHALTVFCPLVDVTAERGSPQFIPGTHVVSDEECNSIDHRVAQFSPLTSTDCIVFDYRLLHRGVANTADTPRPLFYCVYTKKGYTDRHNFGTEPLLTAPTSKNQKPEPVKSKE